MGREDESRYEDEERECESRYENDGMTTAGRCEMRTKLSFAERAGSLSDSVIPDGLGALLAFGTENRPVEAVEVANSTTKQKNPRKVKDVCCSRSFRGLWMYIKRWRYKRREDSLLPCN